MEIIIEQKYLSSNLSSDFNYPENQLNITPSGQKNRPNYILILRNTS